MKEMVEKSIEKMKEIHRVIDTEACSLSIDLMVMGMLDREAIAAIVQVYDARLKLMSATESLKNLLNKAN